MCDKDSNGVIDKEELSEMLRSLVEIARTTSLSDDHVTELIDGMFQVDICLPYPRHMITDSQQSCFKMPLSISRDSFVNRTFHSSGCRTREEGLSHVQRLQADDEGVQG